MPLATVTAYETRLGGNLLRGTIPVPDDWVEGPLHLVHAGTPLPTEIFEVVTRGPADNPRVLELRAWHVSDSGQETYSVEAGAEPSLASFHDNIEMTLALEDHNGVTYEATLLAAGASGAAAGAVTHRVHSTGELLSVGGARHIGFDAYIDTIAGEPDVFLVNMTIQNGNVGDPDDPLGSDILHHLFFNEIRLQLPAGWIHTPMRPQWLQTGPDNLVNDLGTPNFHFVLMGGVHEFRFAVHTAATAGRASVHQSYSGFFVCDHSKSLWSWNNRDTAWYGPQAELVPDLDLSGYLPYSQTYAEISSRMQSGLPTTIHGKLTTPLSMYYTRGGTAPNPTGGLNITGYPGYEIINSGSVSHLKTLMAIQSMDRDRGASHHLEAGANPYYGMSLVDSSQTPIDPGEWDLTDNPTTVQFLDRGHFNINHQGPFTRLSANTAAYDAVKAAGLLPWYWNPLNFFFPYDFAHPIIGLSSPIALTWLFNDPLAKTYIAQDAAWGRMLTSEHNGGELFSQYNKSLAWPGKGGGTVGGRFCGWSMLTCLADWQVADDEKRANYAPWLTMVEGFYANAQLPSGAWHALDNGTPVVDLNTQWSTYNGYPGLPGAAASQAIEIGINSQALRALYVCTGSAAVLTMFRALCTGLWQYHWMVGFDGPHFVSPVRPQVDAFGNPSSPAYASKSAAPDCFTKPPYKDQDNYQIAPIIMGGLHFNAALPAAWSAIYAITGESTPAGALADLTATVTGDDIQVNRLAEGYGALVALLEDLDYEFGISGIGVCSSFGTAAIVDATSPLPAATALSVSIGFGSSLFDASRPPPPPGELAGVGISASLGLAVLQNASGLQKTGPGGGTRRRGSAGAVVRR